MALRNSSIPLISVVLAYALSDRHNGQLRAIPSSPDTCQHMSGIHTTACNTWQKWVPNGRYGTGMWGAYVNRVESSFGWWFQKGFWGLTDVRHLWWSNGEGANCLHIGSWKSSSLSDSDIVICFSALFGCKSPSGMAFILRLPILQNLNPEILSETHGQYLNTTL